MDSELILTKLDSLQRCVRRVEAKTPDNLEQLQTDPDAQDIIALNLERAVQICVDIAFHLISRHPECSVPETMGAAFESLVRLNLLAEADGKELIGAVGFRNVSVHAYTEIDWRIVYQVASEKLGLFERFASQVLKSLPKP